MIEKASAVAVLSYPLRQELIDTLEACGGQATVGELAEQLGRPADGLYYHLRLLVRAGLIAELPGRSSAGRAERRYRISVRGRGPLRIAYRMDDPRYMAVVHEVAAAMLRLANRDFGRAIRDRSVAVDGPRRELWAARGQGWVNARDHAELVELLARAQAILGKPHLRRGAQRREDHPRRRHGDRLISLCFLLAPVRPRPKRRT